MSKEDARKFIDHVKSHPELVRQVEQRGTSLTNEDMVAMAKSAGFDCSVDELDAVGLSMMTNELSDAALDQVAGGTGPTATSPQIQGSTNYKVEPVQPGTTAVNVKPGIAASGLIPCSVTVKSTKL